MADTTTPTPTPASAPATATTTEAAAPSATEPSQPTQQQDTPAVTAEAPKPEAPKTEAPSTVSTATNEAAAPAPATQSPTTSTPSTTATTTTPTSAPAPVAKGGRQQPPRSRSTSRTGGPDKNIKSQPRSRSNSINRAAQISPREAGPGKICDGVITGESHPLQTPWTWWFSRKTKRGRVNSFTSGPNAAPPGGAGYIIGSFKPHDPLEEDNVEIPPPVRGRRGSDSDDLEHRGGLSQICTCTTVEEFWAQYSYLQRPSMLPKESNYYFFRNNTEPMWETFPKGGCFIVRIKKKGAELNKLWEELLFATIGETFEEPNVMGVVVSIRSKEDALSVWTKTNSTNIRARVGELLKQILSLDKNAVIAYKSNASAMRDKSTYKNAKKIFVAN